MEKYSKSRHVEEEKNPSLPLHGDEILFCTLRTSPYIYIHRYDTACAPRKWRILRRMSIKKIWLAIVIWTSENLGWCGGGRRDRGSRRDERHRGLSYPRVHDTQVPHCCVVRIGVALLRGWWGGEVERQAAGEPRLTCEPVCRWQWTWDGNSPSRDTRRRKKERRRERRRARSSVI